MIIYKDILGQLRSAGYSTNQLRKERLISESTIQRIRESRPINTTTIDKICQLLNCQPSDILEVVPDDHKEVE